MGSSPTLGAFTQKDKKMDIPFILFMFQAILLILFVGWGLYFTFDEKRKITLVQSKVFIGFVLSFILIIISMFYFGHVEQLQREEQFKTNFEKLGLNIDYDFYQSLSDEEKASILLLNQKKQ